MHYTAQACAYLRRHRLNELGGFREFGENIENQLLTSTATRTNCHLANTVRDSAAYLSEHLLAAGL